jgi:hypothetical protein
MKTTKRTLNVKVTNIAEMTEKWGFLPPTPFRDILMPIYVRCNCRGEVNWEKTYLYCHMDLVGRVIRIHQ